MQLDRNRFIQNISELNREQAIFKPAHDKWSILENAEHIVLAEKMGICKMWMSVEDYKKNPVASQSTNVRSVRKNIYRVGFRANYLSKSHFWSDECCTAIGVFDFSLRKASSANR